MAFQMIHTVYDGERYLEQYGSLFSRAVSQKQLKDYAGHELHKDSALQRYIKKGQETPCSLLPIFTPENTALLAQKLQEVASATSEMSRDCLHEISIVWGDRWHTEAHSLLVHVVLSNLLQSIWLEMVAPNTCGSITIFDSIEECSVLSTYVLPLSEMNVLVYWQNNLQEGNWILSKAFANRHMSRMLRSVDEQGLMLPSGGVEAQLLEMKLIRAVRLNGSQIPSYKIATPVINKEDIYAIKNHLQKLATIGHGALARVKEILLQERMQVFPHLRCVAEDLYLQSCYGVWCYALYHEWLSQGLLPKLGRVPNLYDRISNRSK